MMPLQGDMLYRGFKHSVMKFKIKSVSWMSFKTYLELNYNQALIRKYEIISADFESSRQTRIHTERGHTGTSFLFRKYPLVPDDTNNYEFIYIFTLKEYFFI